MWFKRGGAQITEQDLSDFADGELPRYRAIQVAAHLRSHPVDADRIHAYWRQEANLYRAFESVLDESEAPMLPRTNKADSLRILPWVAVLSAIMITAGLIWDASNGMAPNQSLKAFTATILETYRDSPRISQWQKAGSVPSLVDLGLKPVGARTIHLDNRKAVEYRYQGDQGERVALYEMEAGVDEAGLFQIFERDKTRLVEWTIAGKRYALVGEESASRLTHLAVQIRGNLMTQQPDDVRQLAEEVDHNLRLNNDDAEPIMVQSPANARVYADPVDPVLVPQSTIDANAKPANGMNGINNVTPELSTERLQKNSTEM